MKDRSSLTAEYMALFRALESARPPDSRLFCDPFARLFLHHGRKALHALAQIPFAAGFVEMLLDQSAPGARAAGIARTKWIDDEATQALALIPQLVLLGAGFDARAYRLPAARRVTTFELDHPETARTKQMVLQRKLGSFTKVQFVHIDFNKESLTEALNRSGFKNDQPACFIWEGVTNYLTPEAVDSALRQIARAASGSTLLFTYVHRDVLNQPQRFFGAEKLMARLQSYGEPWTFGLHPEEIQTYLAERGLQLVKDLSVAEVWLHAGRSNAGIRGYEFYRLASASVK
jgi:methyltransferase (TIGR00027 family)